MANDTLLDALKFDSAGLVAAVAQQHGIAIAIEPQRHDSLDLARGLALAPERLARARPVDGVAGRQRLLDRLTVHPGQHQDLAGVVLLRHRGH